MKTQDNESLPIIGEKQIALPLQWQPLIDATETALMEFSTGKLIQLNSECR